MRTPLLRFVRKTGESKMNATLKTLILAAAGAAVIAASPASAQPHKRALTHHGATQNVLPRGGSSDPDLWERGEINASPSVDQYGQIREEYLKDDTMHNGNAY
jgi:hypothetical protein